MSKKWLITLFVIVVLCGLLAFMTPALARSEPNTQDASQPNPQIELSSGDYTIFIKLEGIAGESTDASHKDWVEALSFNWGMTMPVSTSSGSGASAARVQVMNFNFTHNLDKASPKLMSSCATGQHIKTATLEVYSKGEHAVKFYQLMMSDVVVNKVYLMGNSRTGDESTAQLLSLDIPLEEVSLTFAKIEWSYWPRKADGSMTGEVKGSYDSKTNRAQ